MRKLFLLFILALVSGLMSPRTEAADYPNPDPIPPGELNFDDIRFWTGTGDCRSALVIQWSTDAARYAYVFGYRWESRETVTSIDMLKAVTHACRRLYGCWTDGTTYGSTVNGLGWSPACRRNLEICFPDGSVASADSDGEFTCSASQLDGASPVNPDDWFDGGWYEGYWSFWVMEYDENMMHYSDVGASSRILSDGSTDGWMFAPDLITGSWKPWVMAPLDTETDPATGLSDIRRPGLDCDAASPVYYNLQGLRVNSPSGGIFIERRGANVRKIMIP